MDINAASAIVTGGASGIGAAVARLLSARGAKVVVADLNSDAGGALAEEIGRSPGAGRVATPIERAPLDRAPLARAAAGLATAPGIWC